jgi:hypothetical protein
MTLSRPLKRLFKRRPKSAARDLTTPFDAYESRAPGPQNCIDAIPGWNTRFPDEYGVVAGNLIHFADDRILWALERFGSVAGANVLEVGPMEGAHTYLLHQRGASVTAVEANKQAFLKCLITKEIVGLPRAKFLLGDSVQYLEQTEQRYDLIVACGVLYHMVEPLRFLRALASRTDALYLWTSFIDETPTSTDDLAANALQAHRETQEFMGVTATTYRMSYCDAHLDPRFCGGIYDGARWLDRASILGALRALGFSSLEIAHEATPHPHHPCFSVFARRA